MISEGQQYLAAQIREQPIFTAFADFFERVRNGRPSPELGDIDLMSEYRLARNLYIFDIHEGDQNFWIRFAGSNIAEFFGFETTNRYLETLNFQENFEATLDGYRTIVREKAPYAFLNYIAFEEPRLNEYKKGQQFVMIRLAFPIFDAEGNVGNILGAMDFLDIDAAPNQRFVQLPLAEIMADG